MKKLAMATTLLAFTICTAATAQDAPKVKAIPPTIGYNRPDPDTQRQADGKHSNVVYWNDTFDHYSVTMQSAADATSCDELIFRSDKRKK